MPYDATSAVAVVAVKQGWQQTVFIEHKQVFNKHEQERTPDTNNKQSEQCSWPALPIKTLKCRSTPETATKNKLSCVHKIYQIKPELQWITTDVCPPQPGGL